MKRKVRNIHFHWQRVLSPWFAPRRKAARTQTTVPPVARLCILLAAIVNCATVQAATLDGVLDTVQNKYRSLATLSARFSQTTKIELLGKTVTSTGTLELRKPGKLRITYDDPNGKTYISNGKTLWVVDKATKQTDTFKIGSSQVPKEALTFLNGFGDIRTTYGVNTWTPGKNGSATVQLVPMAATSYTALDGTFSKNGILQKLVIYNRTGNISRYAFSDIRENPDLLDSQFENTR